MSARPLTIAVTGLNATDNPGPGVPVLRSLRDGARAGARRIGLTYDALDPGVYARDLADQVFLLTYPSAGAWPTHRRGSRARARGGRSATLTE